MKNKLNKKVKLKEILIGIAVLAVLASNVLIFSKLDKETFGGITQLKNDFQVQGSLSTTASTTIDSSLDVAGKIRLNRLALIGVEQAFILATNTPCDYRPTATSTLISWGIQSDATSSQAERIVSIWRQAIDEGGFGYATASTDTLLASTTIGGKKQLSFEIGSSTSLFGDFANNNFDPEAKEAVGRLFTPQQALVVHEDSSNLDKSTDNAKHSIPGSCSFLFQEVQ